MDSALPLTSNASKTSASKNLDHGSAGQHSKCSFGSRICRSTFKMLLWITDLPVNIQNAPLDHGSAGQHSKCSFGSRICWSTFKMLLWITDLPVNIQNAPLDHGSAGQHSKCSFGSWICWSTFKMLFSLQYYNPCKAKFSSQSLSSIHRRSPDKRLQHEDLTHHWRVPPLAWCSLAKMQILP